MSGLQDGLFGSRTLTLTKGECDDFFRSIFFFFRREGINRGQRIAAVSQDEHDGLQLVRGYEGGTEVERGHLDELGRHVFGHEGLDCENNLVRPDAPQNDQPLEVPET